MIGVTTAGGVGSVHSVVARGCYLDGQLHRKWPQKAIVMVKINLQKPSLAAIAAVPMVLVVLG